LNNVNDPFNLRDSAGKLDPSRCLTLARNSLLTRPDIRDVATDEMVELAEVVVPGLVAELTGRKDDALDKEASKVFDEAKERHLGKILRALNRIDISGRLHNITFTIPPTSGSKDDPIIIKATVPAESWDHIPELQARLEQLKAAKNND